MPVRDTSKLSFEGIRERFGPDQGAVLAVLEEIGPASDKQILDALNYKEQAAYKPKNQRRLWTINIVTPRRGELVGFFVVEDLGKFKRPGMRLPVHLWWARGDYREPLGWQKVEGEELPSKPQRDLLAARRHIEEIRQMAQAPIVKLLERYSNGTALAENRTAKTINEGQMVFSFSGK